MDHTTGTIMLEKNADKLMAPSSMTKMMTLYVAFSKIRNGELSFGDRLTISKKAAAMRGSRMFLRAGQKVVVEDLIKGIAIQSGNDAAVALAEGIAGSESAFVEQMNRMATRLGMRNTHFQNATGWPHAEHLSTARDILILARRTLSDFAEFYNIYGTRKFTFAGITQKNRNPLLHGYKGGDGIKTGHTSMGGYGLAGSARRGNRRLILIVNGLGSEEARRTESRRIMEWGFKNFENFLLFDGGSPVDDARVWMGEKDTVALRINAPVLVTMPRESRESMKVKVIYHGPVPAPIRRGQVIAQLSVEAPNFRARTYPLVAAENVERLGLLGRFGFAVQYLIFGVEG